MYMGIAEIPVAGSTMETLLPSVLAAVAGQGAQLERGRVDLGNAAAAGAVVGKAAVVGDGIANVAFGGGGQNGVCQRRR
jgi:hypothetical protein